MESVKSTEVNPLILPADLTRSTTSQFLELVQSILDSRVTELKIDCSRINNASSSHISILWEAYDLCKSNKVKIILEEATTSLVRVLFILDLGELFGLGSHESGFKSADKRETVSDQDSHIHTEQICVSREKLSQSVEAFLKFSSTHGVPEITDFEMRTVFCEVMTNVIDHSGLTESDNVKFTAKIKGNHMNMVFEDLGVAFDPTIYHGSADLDDLITAAKERRFRGFGLLMIRKLVDKIKYSRKEDTVNHLEIEKYWS